MILVFLYRCRTFFFFFFLDLLDFLLSIYSELSPFPVHLSLSQTLPFSCSSVRVSG